MKEFRIRLYSAFLAFEHGVIFIVSYLHWFRFWLLWSLPTVILLPFTNSKGKFNQQTGGYFLRVIMMNEFFLSLFRLFQQREYNSTNKQWLFFLKKTKERENIINDCLNEFSYILFTVGQMLKNKEHIRRKPRWWRSGLKRSLSKRKDGNSNPSLDRPKS